MKEMKHMSTSSLWGNKRNQVSATVRTMNIGNALTTTTYKRQDLLARKIMQQSASKCGQYTGHILMKGVSK